MEIGSVRSITQMYEQNNIADNKDRAVIRPEDDKVSQNGRTLESDDSKVIGVSSDGDTAKASREAIEELNDGMVMSKSSENAAVVSSSSSDKSAESEIESLTGFTKDELSRLKNTGEISQNDFDREIERRDQITGDDSKAKQSVSEKINPGTDAVKSATDNIGITGNTATAGTTGIADAQKAENSGLQNDATKEEQASADKSREIRKEIISEEIESGEEFAKRMNNLSYAGENIQLQMSGLQTALENNRGDIATQIFDTGLIKGITQI